MSTEENVQIVKDWFEATGGDTQRLLALSDENIEWIIPGENWPLAGTHRGHAGLTDLLARASELETSYPWPPEYVAQGDRVLVIGRATGKVKATGKPFVDFFVFAITVRNGRLTHIREYVDTQALARASKSDSSRETPGCSNISSVLRTCGRTASSRPSNISTSNPLRLNSRLEFGVAGRPRVRIRLVLHPSSTGKERSLSGSGQPSVSQTCRKTCNSQLQSNPSDTSRRDFLQRKSPVLP